MWKLTLGYGIIFCDLLTFYYLLNTFLHIPYLQLAEHHIILYRVYAGLSNTMNCLRMKEGSLFCLFCLYLWDPLNQDALDRLLGLFGKLLRRTGALAWFHGVGTCGVEVLEYWMIFSLKIKLNCSEIFWRNWNVPLVLLERSWWEGLDEIYSVRFGFRMWEGDIDFLSDFCRWKFK